MLIVAVCAVVASIINLLHRCVSIGAARLEAGDGKAKFPYSHASEQSLGVGEILFLMFHMRLVSCAEPERLTASEP